MFLASTAFACISFLVPSTDGLLNRLSSETTAPAEHGRAAGSEAANPLKKLLLFEGSPSAAAEAASGPPAAGATKEGAGAPGLAPAPARAPVGPSPPVSGMPLGQAPAVAAGAGETVGTQTMPAATAPAAGLPEESVPVQGEAEQSGMGAGLKKALLFGESGGEGVRTEGPEQHAPAQHAGAQHAAVQRTEGVVAQGSGGGVGHSSAAEAVEGGGNGGGGLAAGMKKMLLFGEGESRPAEPVTEAAPVVASSGGGVQVWWEKLGYNIKPLQYLPFYFEVKKVRPTLDIPYLTGTESKYCEFYVYVEYDTIEVYATPSPSPFLGLCPCPQHY